MGNSDDYIEEEYYYESYEKEKDLKGLPRPLNLEEIDLIKMKMQKSVFKIKCIDGSGSGFFCKIPFPDTFNLLPVLITNYHVLNEKEIQNDINLIINDNTPIIIKKDYSRKVYIDKKYDVTMIEIKDKDNLNEFSFLEVDTENIYKDNLNNYYNDKNIYLLHYPFGERVSSSLGTIKRIFKDNIYHNCSSQKGSSGGPLINKFNFKVIGIHKGANNSLDYNLATFIKRPIEEFKRNSNNIEYLNSGELTNNWNNNIISNLIDNKSDDEITIEYKFNNINDKIKIFGKNFVENNKNNCKIILNGKEIDLCIHLNKKDLNLVDNTLRIKLKGINNIINISYMFERCESSSISIPDIAKWNTNKIIDMNHLFYKCYTLNILPDISNFNTENVTNFNSMFCCCGSITSLPDISNWNTNKVTDMGHLFSECYLLQILPDISKWKTNNVTNMKNMFYQCISLNDLPEISKWNTNNVISMENMLVGCEKIKNIPYPEKKNNDKNFNYQRQRKKQKERQKKESEEDIINRERFNHFMTNFDEYF